MKNKVHIIFDKTKKSLKIKNLIIKKINKHEFKQNKLVIVIGGDGFMLETLKKNKNSNKRFYGINSGNYGFLMNKFSSNNILKNLSKANMISISPLEMLVKNKNNQIKKSLAINEVSILRQSKQAASISIKHGSKQIIKKLVSDGVLVSTPAGSTAYNLSVHGPILSLNSKKLSIAPISPFRPRRWKGKIVNDKLKITITNLNLSKRPISAVADNFEVRNAKSITIKTNNKIKTSPHRKSGTDIAIPFIPSIIPSVFVSLSLVPKSANNPPRRQAIIKAIIESSNVAGNLPNTKERTGWRSDIEFPKSPCKTPLIQMKNC